MIASQPRSPLQCSCYSTRDNPVYSQPPVRWVPFFLSTNRDKETFWCRSTPNRLQPRYHTCFDSTMVTPPSHGVTLPVSLEAARIDSLPATAYYIPNFISVEEEQLILDKVRFRLTISFVFTRIGQLF